MNHGENEYGLAGRSLLKDVDLSKEGFSTCWLSPRCCAIKREITKRSVASKVAHRSDL